MDTSQQSTERQMKRQRRSIAEKRRMVEETLADGASVARVARANGVNANQVFYWRKLYLAGRLGSGNATQLLPVRVTQEKSAPTIALAEAVSRGELSSGMIHVELNQAQVHIESGADPAIVRVLLECLRA